MERRQIDLGLVEILDRVRESEANRGPRRSKAEPRSAPRAGTRREGRRRGAQAGAAARPRRNGGQAEAMSRRSVVIGTAGHIDHGKSALVQALTGTDPDRLKEETGPRHHHRPRLRARRGRRRHAGVRGRARARALRQEHARRRRRHRPRPARRRGRRVGDAADARALRHLPAAPGRAPGVIALTKIDLADRRYC